MTTSIKRSVLLAILFLGVAAIAHASDDSTLKLGSIDGSTQFAVQNNTGGDIFYVTSLGNVKISSTTILPGTTVYPSGLIMNSGYLMNNSATLANPGNGTNATCTWGAGSTNSYGILSVVMAAGGSAGNPLCTVTTGFTAPHGFACSLTPQNAAAAKIPINDGPFVTSSTTQWILTNNGVGLPTGTYTWFYLCAGY